MCSPGHVSLPISSNIPGGQLLLHPLSASLTSRLLSKHHLANAVLASEDRTLPSSMLLEAVLEILSNAHVKVTRCLAPQNIDGVDHAEIRDMGCTHKGLNRREPLLEGGSLQIL